MTEPRFFIDHGVIHDRETGKHVVTDGTPPFEDSIEQVCEFLNRLAPKADLVAFSASEAACYHYPDDTPEHRLAREAFCAGAVAASLNQQLKEPT